MAEQYKRKYIAIGHWKGSGNVTCVSTFGLSIKDFQGTLSVNGFVSYVVMTEERFNRVKDMDSFDLFETVKKMTTNYRVWAVVTDYILQCSDVIEERLSKV